MVHVLWTPRRRRLVERFVATAQQRLRLADWEVICDFDVDAGPDAVAHVIRSADQKRVVIRFSVDNFLGDSAANQRQTLAHELLHCHLFDVHEAAQVAIAAVPGAAHRKTLTEVARSRVEQATDALADAFVAMLADLPVPASDAPLRMFEGMVDADADAPEPDGPAVLAPTPAPAAAKRPPRRPGSLSTAPRPRR